MKREGKERREHVNHGIDKKSEQESESGEFGFVYEFFMSEISGLEEELDKTKAREERKKREDSFNQSQAFFLPDYFNHED